VTSLQILAIPRVSLRFFGGVLQYSLFPPGEGWGEGDGVGKARPWISSVAALTPTQAERTHLMQRTHLFAAAAFALLLALAFAFNPSAEKHRPRSRKLLRSAALSQEHLASGPLRHSPPHTARGASTRTPRRTNEPSRSERSAWCTCEIFCQASSGMSCVRRRIVQARSP